jgi:hypothetical protein
MKFLFFWKPLPRHDRICGAGLADWCIYYLRWRRTLGCFSWPKDARQVISDQCRVFQTAKDSGEPKVFWLVHHAEWFAQLSDVAPPAGGSLCSRALQQTGRWWIIGVYRTSAVPSANGKLQNARKKLKLENHGALRRNDYVVFQAWCSRCNWLCPFENETPP